jgi:asparagine synthase (glutamine-hydrolysing)
VAKDQSSRGTPALARWWRGLMPESAARQRVRGDYFAKYQTGYIRSNLGHYAEDGDSEQRVQANCEDILACGITSHGDLYTYMGLRYYTAEPNFRIPDVIGLTEQVEVRSPFLNHRVVEFAARLPAALKVANTNDPRGNKFLLKTYHQKHVPEQLAWASKKGMGWNLRYDRTLATDPDLIYSDETQLRLIEGARLPSQKFREAWMSYVRDKKAGVEYPATVGTMSSGLMLGLWLDRTVVH